LIDAARAQVLSPTKDEMAPYPIAAEWRPTFREVVCALVEGDFLLSRGIPRVRPVPPARAEQMRKYVGSYGETLMPLPDDSWQTSESQWMGSFWDVSIDLWTVREGRSDMVLDARVFEADGGYEIELISLYVP